MDEDRHRTSDIIFKWSGLVAVLVSAWWTVHKYHEDVLAELRKDREAKEAEVRTFERDRKKEQDSFVFQHQADLYFEASRVAATLATARDAKILRPARVRFEQLYWGELAVVEDRRVEIAMIAFRRCLTTPDKKKCSHADVDQHGRQLNPAELNRVLAPAIENLALEIGACARKSLEEQRRISLGQIEPVLTPAKSICPYN